MQRKHDDQTYFNLDSIYLNFGTVHSDLCKSETKN